MPLQKSLLKVLLKFTAQDSVKMQHKSHSEKSLRKSALQKVTAYIVHCKKCHYQCTKLKLPPNQTNFIDTLEAFKFNLHPKLEEWTARLVAITITLISIPIEISDNKFQVVKGTTGNNML